MKNLFWFHLTRYQTEIYDWIKRGHIKDIRRYTAWIKHILIIFSTSKSFMTSHEATKKWWTISRILSLKRFQSIKFTTKKALPSQARHRYVFICKMKFNIFDFCDSFAINYDIKNYALIPSINVFYSAPARSAQRLSEFSLLESYDNFMRRWWFRIEWYRLAFRTSDNDLLISVSTFIESRYCGKSFRCGLRNETLPSQTFIQK